MEIEITINNRKTREIFQELNQHTSCKAISTDSGIRRSSHG